MKTIRTYDNGWQEGVKQAMDNREQFLLVTRDREWDPNSNNPLDVAKWIYGSLIPIRLVRILKQHGIGLGAYATASGSVGPLDQAEHVAIVGASSLMLLGAGMVVLAFLDPEPTSKLGLMVGGGICCIFGGGMVFAVILLTRRKYKWKQRINPSTGEVEWEAEPCD